VVVGLRYNQVYMRSVIIVLCFQLQGRCSTHDGGTNVYICINGGASTSPGHVDLTPVFI